MTFNDIFKSSFIENVSSFSMLDMVIALGLAFALGLFILFVYNKTFNGVMYSKSFSVSLMAMTMVTALVILAISSNVVLSLGMVGALSIVRFRAAIKEPLDIVFLFWSVAAGIVVGAGLIPLAVFGSIFIGIILVVFVNKKSNDSPYILVINCTGDKVEELVTKAVDVNVEKHILKSKTVTCGSVELTLEVRLKSSTTEFINMISNINGVNNVALVSYNGEYMS